MTALRFDDLRQHSDVLRLRSGNALTVRFVEPRDAVRPGVTWIPEHDRPAGRERRREQLDLIHSVEDRRQETRSRIDHDPKVIVLQHRFRLFDRWHRLDDLCRLFHVLHQPVGPVTQCRQLRRPRLFATTGANHDRASLR